MTEIKEKKKRGLGSASKEVRERVSRAGGQAPHKERGLQVADRDTKSRVARVGGIARGEQRRKQRDKKKVESTEETLDE